MNYYVVKCKQTGKFARDKSLNANFNNAKQFSSIKEAKKWIRIHITDWQKWITVKVVACESRA